MKILSCPACNAPLTPDANQCPYCHVYFERTPTTDAPETHHDSNQPQSSTVHGIAFCRQVEPNEGAFSLSIPSGWQVEGGITRANLTHQVVDVQAIEAKLDFTVKRDAPGSVLIRWCPEIKFCDVRGTPAGMMGMFPPGSNYQGMIVSSLVPAVDFLIHNVFPWAHPHASDVQLVERQEQPLLVETYRQRMAALGFPAQGGDDGGTATYTYTEDGVRYQEKAQAVIESLGPMTGGMWSNKDTLILRAPAGELEHWEPVLRHAQDSVKLNFQWLAQEVVNQEFLTRSFMNAQQAAIARDRRMLEIQQQIQQIDREITEHRMRTNAEIMNDEYLNLMSLEEYVNPYTNEPETGSNQWEHRWVNAEGDEFYTDNETDDPNIPSLLNRSDWRRTPVRPRFPQ